LLQEQENSRSQDTACPLTVEGELQQQEEVIPKGFKNPDQVDGTETIPHSVEYEELPSAQPSGLGLIIPEYVVGQKFP
jgi:hypothetical protein